MENLIQQIIKNSGKTQADFAKAVGVAQPTIIKWIKGKGINAKYLQALADASQGQVTVEQLAKALDHRNRPNQKETKK